jgi:hypothetical protein
VPFQIRLAPTFRARLQRNLSQFEHRWLQPNLLSFSIAIACPLPQTILR